jgi:hypothetical protein
MKKRILSLFVAVLMIMATVACDVSENNETSTPNENGGTIGNNNTSLTQDNKPNYSLIDTVIVDDENVAFTITSVKDSGFWGFTLKVFCENKTDKDLMFSWDNVSVNGYMIDPFWATEIAAGRKSNTEISFSDSALERANISSVDEIVFKLRVYDSNDWQADNFVNDEFIIYPTGMDSSLVVYPLRNATDTERVIVDNESITFIIEGVTNDPIWGYTLNCYLENKTSEPLMFSWDNVSVNGFMVDPFWANEVQPGKRNFSDINFSNSKFEENNISNVEEIEFKLRVYNSDNWSADDIINEVFTYMP